MTGRPPRTPVRALVSGAVAALVLAGCATEQGGTPELRADAERGFVSGDGSVQLVAPADREAVDDVAGETLDGGTLDLAELRGTPVVLNVWGSWCAPCHAEAPELVAASEELGETAEFVGIDIRDRSRQSALAFEEQYGITWPSLYDPDSLHLLALRGAVPPQAVPATLVLDAEGRVAARVLGQVEAGTLVDIVGDVAQETGAA